MALFARFLVVILSRPDFDVKEIISSFELALHPKALFTSQGSLRHCVNKSKLMHILEGQLLQRMQPTVAPCAEHNHVVITDAMAIGTYRPWGNLRGSRKDATLQIIF
jgi:hypothetical protein